MTNLKKDHNFQIPLAEVVKIFKEYNIFFPDRH